MFRKKRKDKAPGPASQSEDEDQVLAKKLVSRMSVRDTLHRLDVLSMLHEVPDTFQGRRYRKDALSFHQPLCTGANVFGHEFATNWRLNRMRLGDVGLVMCLNIGTDPPDVERAAPHAVEECWIDPFSITPTKKALETIGKALQDQYMKLQSRAKYRLCLDPTVDDMRRLAANLRKHNQEDRVLLHIVGHGVPRPTTNGEIWLFNKNFTQYMPLSIYDLQAWVGQPAMFIFDCSSAGRLIPHFHDYYEDSVDMDRMSRRRSSATSGISIGTPSSLPRRNRATSSGTSDQLPHSRREWILFCACGAEETLPTNPNLPADLFTACLTTPVKLALRWFAQFQPAVLHSNCMEMIDKLPGEPTERSTPYGHLNWVLTSITDTIAWTLLPRDQFLHLFRQDQLVATLCRNFLFAEYIMKWYGCHPQSLPAMPTAVDHPLWDTWRLTMESVVSQLPAMLGQDPRSPDTRLLKSPTPGTQLNPTSKEQAGGLESKDEGIEDRKSEVGGRGSKSRSKKKKKKEKEKSRSRRSRRREEKEKGKDGAPETPKEDPSTFFEEQLTAFEVWLQFVDSEEEEPPQLPILLQVLLSPAHRKRALQLLARYLDRGALAVHQALTVGVFPYVLKLLQNPVAELRHVLVFVWSRIILLDPSCRKDLVSAGAHLYFIAHMATPAPELEAPQPEDRQDSSAVGASASAQQLSAYRSNLLRHPDAAIHRGRLGSYVLGGLNPNTAAGALADGSDGGSISPDQRIAAAYVLCMIMHSDRECQTACLQGGLLDAVSRCLQDEQESLRLWAALALGQLCENFDEARIQAIQSKTFAHLLPLLEDASPEVRAAACSTFGFICRGSDPDAPEDTVFDGPSMSLFQAKRPEEDLIMPNNRLSPYSHSSSSGFHEGFMTPPKGNKAPTSPSSSRSQYMQRQRSNSHSTGPVRDILMPQGLATGCLIEFSATGRLRLREPAWDPWDGLFQLSYANALLVVNKGKMLVRPYSPGGAFDVIAFASRKLREYKERLESLKALTFVEHRSLARVPHTAGERMPGSDPGASLRLNNGGPFNRLDVRRRSHVVSSDWGYLASSLNDSFGDGGKFRSGSPLEPTRRHSGASPEPPVQYRNSLAEVGYGSGLFERAAPSPPEGHPMPSGTPPRDVTASLPNSVMNALMNNAIPEELKAGGGGGVGSQSLPRSSYTHSVMESTPPTGSVLAKLLMGGGVSPPDPPSQGQGSSEEPSTLPVDKSHEHFFAQSGLSAASFGLTAFRAPGQAQVDSTAPAGTASTGAATSRLASVTEEPRSNAPPPVRIPEEPGMRPRPLIVDTTDAGDEPGWLLEGEDENEGEVSPLPGQEADMGEEEDVHTARLSAALPPSRSEFLPSEFSFYQQSKLEASGVHSRTKLELSIAACVITCASDASPVVRKETLLALSKLIIHPRHSLAFEAVLAALEAMKRGSKEMSRDIEEVKAKAGQESEAPAMGGLKASPSTASLFPSTPRNPGPRRGSSELPSTPEHSMLSGTMASPEGYRDAAWAHAQRRESDATYPPRDTGASAAQPSKHFGTVGDEFWEVAQRNADDYWGPEVEVEEAGEEPLATAIREETEEEDPEDLGLDLAGIVEDAADALQQVAGPLQSDPAGAGRSRGISFVARDRDRDSRHDAGPGSRVPQRMPQPQSHSVGHFSSVTPSVSAASSPRAPSAQGTQGAHHDQHRPTNVHISVLVDGLRKLLGTRGILYLGLWRRLNRLQRDPNPGIAAQAAILVARLRSRLITTHHIAFPDSSKDTSEPPHLFLPPPAALDIPTANARSSSTHLNVPGHGSLTFRSRTRRRMMSSHLSMGDIPAFAGSRSASGPMPKAPIPIDSRGAASHGKPPLFFSSGGDHLPSSMVSEDPSSYGSYTIRGRFLVEGLEAGGGGGSGGGGGGGRERQPDRGNGGGRSVSLEQPRPVFGGGTLQAQGARRSLLPSAGWDIHALGVVAASAPRPRGGSLGSPDLGAVPAAAAAAAAEKGGKGKRKGPSPAAPLLEGDVLRAVAFGGEDTLDLHSRLFHWHSYDFAKRLLKSSSSTVSVDPVSNAAHVESTKRQQLVSAVAEGTLLAFTCLPPSLAPHVIERAVHTVARIDRYIRKDLPTATPWDALVLYRCYPKTDSGSDASMHRASSRLSVTRNRSLDSLSLQTTNSAFRKNRELDSPARQPRSLMHGNTASQDDWESKSGGGSEYGKSLRGAPPLYYNESGDDVPQAVHGRRGSEDAGALHLDTSVATASAFFPADGITPRGSSQAPHRGTWETPDLTEQKAGAWDFEEEEERKAGHPHLTIRSPTRPLPTPSAGTGLSASGLSYRSEAVAEPPTPLPVAMGAASSQGDDAEPSTQEEVKVAGKTVVAPRLGLPLVASLSTQEVEKTRRSLKKLRQLSIFNNGTSGTTQVLFHPSLPLLYSLADGDEIGCWNYETGAGNYKFRATEDVPLASLLPRHRGGSSTASSPRSGFGAQFPLPDLEVPTLSLNAGVGTGGGPGGGGGARPGSSASRTTTAIAQHLSKTSMRLRKHIRGDFGWVVPPQSLASGGSSWKAFHQWWPGSASHNTIQYTEADSASVGEGAAADKGAGGSTPRSYEPEGPQGTSSAVIRRHKTQITSMTWVNEHSTPLLLTGSNDGDVRVWGGMEEANPSTLRCITSFSALPDIIRRSRGSGLVMEWQPRPGVLLVGGNSSIVRCWDMEREQCVGMVKTPGNSCITSMTSAWPGHGVFAMGSGSGHVHLVDMRVCDRSLSASVLDNALGAPPAVYGAVVGTMKEHHAWVVNVGIQRAWSGYKMYSASTKGDLKIWDLRNQESIKTVQAHKKSDLTSMAVHNYAPLIATGTLNQYIKVFDLEGKERSVIRYHDGFLGQRIGPVTNLAFHPHRLFLGAGATDSIISVYSGDRDRK